MTDITAWMRTFVEVIKDAFGKNVLFIGLQGSYSRREEGPDSDIDVVVILERLDWKNLQLYESAISGLPCREKICGFVSGKDEILHWEASDLLSFRYETIPCFGELDPLLPETRREDVIRGIRMGAGNLYHALIHDYLHEKNGDMIVDLYKQAAFLIQSLHWVQTGEYIKRKTDLKKKAALEDRKILETSELLKKKKKADWEEVRLYGENLLLWSSTVLKQRAR